MNKPQLPVPDAPRARPLAAALAVASVLASALWVSICAAAPEFIWRGMQITLGHLDLATVLSALLIGMILAFFVEPLMKLLQSRLEGGGHARRDRSAQRSPLFAAGLGLAFAFTSVSVHDAMIAFVSASDAGHAREHPGLAAGIALTAAWAIVPLVVTIAWMSRESRRLRLPTGLAAAASAGIAGWLFGWTGPEMISTVIPCLLILAAGYRQLAKAPQRTAFARCARAVATIAAVWLVAAVIVDAVLDLGRLGTFRFYDAAGVWIDARFYLGWTIGLVLAPFPFRAAEGEAA